MMSKGIKFFANSIFSLKLSVIFITSNAVLKNQIKAAIRISLFVGFFISAENFSFIDNNLDCEINEFWWK